MYKYLKELYLLLNLEQRNKLIRLQVLVVIMAFAEVAGVLSVGPFMALVADSQQLNSGLLNTLFVFSGLESGQDFLFWFGLSVLGVLFIATMLSMFTTWKLTMYGSQIGSELSVRLYNYYMHQSWVYHTKVNSSSLTKQIAQEVSRVTHQIITPLMLMNAKIVFTVVMATSIFIVNPMVALMGVLVFSLSYFMLYKVVKSRLVNNGRNVTSSQMNRYKLMAEGFGGIKDVLVLGRQTAFVDKFIKSSDLYAYSSANNAVLSQIPRYAMELVAFSAIIFLILIMLTQYGGDLSVILPLLAVYALAGLKMLPAFQQIYRSVSSIRGNLVAFEAIYEDLVSSKEESYKYGMLLGDKGDDISGDIELDNVSFKYPGKEEFALNGVSLTIPRNQTVGFVGESGSGKSTLIDIVLGLISPDSGRLIVDNKYIDKSNERQWQNSIGFVPQSIFLSDNSIKMNIAFGLSEEEIDDEKIIKSIGLAHLEGLIDDLPDGVNTHVGERGVQLSGGQRQRIGIARALYNDAKVLVLDEATSALDGITEKLIMDAIHDFSGNKTIIMIAHRLSTVKECDVIFMIEDGAVKDSGSYDELLVKNKDFVNMVAHSS